MSFELTFSFHPFILVGRGNTIWAKSHWQDIIVDNTMNSFLAQNYTCTISHHRIIPIHIYKPQFTNQKHTKLSTSYKLHNLFFFIFYFLMGIQAKYHTRHNKRKELNSLDLIILSLRISLNPFFFGNVIPTKWPTLINLLDPYPTIKFWN